MNKYFKAISFLLVIIIFTTMGMPATVNAASKPITSLKVTPTNKTIYENNQFPLSLSWLPQDATDTDLSYSSNNSGIAKVSSKGVVTGVKPGNAVISVAASGGAIATCAVVVKKKIPVSSVKFFNPFTTIAKNQTKKLTVKVTPSNAYDKGIVWNSSNSKVATVDTNGNITGKTKGKTIITATAKDGSKKQAKITIKVNNVAVKKIAPVNKTVKLFKDAKTKYLKVKFSPANASNKDLKYKSSNPSIISVDKNGKVKMEKKGKAKITITSANGKKTTCMVYGFKKTKSFAKIAPSTVSSYKELVGYDGKKHGVPKKSSLPSKSKYKIEVDIKNQITTVYTKGKSGKYNKVVRYMICSTGILNNRYKTPRGTFKLHGGKIRFMYFNKYDVYAQFATRISGPYLFHSITYTSKRTGAVIKSAYNSLGSPASHGCIRLTVPDAKWIYDNVPKSTKVVITNSKPKNKSLKSKLKLPPVGY